MRTLYLDCSMGAAGDMLTAALLELFPDKEKTVDELNCLGIPRVKYVLEESVKCGIKGSHMSVLIEGEEEAWENHDHDHKGGYDHDHDFHHHHHSSMAEIEAIINAIPVESSVKSDAIAVYMLLAEAESFVHGVSVTDIHFHEVGKMDAIADVTAVCYLINRLKPEQLVVSPIHVGSGQVRCAHGILPVPAPATAKLLEGAPIYSGEIRGELCTPTGAALIKYFATGFGKMPLMIPEVIGYGMGKKDFPAANCVRAILGQTKDESSDIIELSCNMDDMTGEQIGFAMERLFEAGAVEVYTTAVGMKKNRPGILLTVLCRPEKREQLVKAIFTHTTTIGIRENTMQRYTLNRRIEMVDTPYGQVRCKVSTGFGVERRKLEYDDCARIARENNTSILTPGDGGYPS